MAACSQRRLPQESAAWRGRSLARGSFALGASTRGGPCPEPVARDHEFGIAAIAALYAARKLIGVFASHIKRAEVQLQLDGADAAALDVAAAADVREDALGLGALRAAPVDAETREAGLRTRFPFASSALRP